MGDCYPCCQIGRFHRLLVGIVILLVISLGLELLGRMYTQSLWYPLPSRILTILNRFAMDVQFIHAMTLTLGRLATGYLFAVSIGTVLGVVLGINSWLHSNARPVIEFLRPLPVPAIIPLAVLVLGLGDRMRVAIVIFACVWPILLAAMDATAGLDRALRETSATLRIGGIRGFVLIILPTIAPRLYTGVRVSTNVALIAVLLSEMIGRGDGLGGYLVYYQRTFAIGDLYALLLLIALLGWSLNAILGLIERRFVVAMIQ